MMYSIVIFVLTQVYTAFPASSFSEQKFNSKKFLNEVLRQFSFGLRSRLSFGQALKVFVYVCNETVWVLSNCLSIMT